MTPLWPLRGILRVVTRPTALLMPLIAAMAVAFAALGAAGLVGWWLWPEAEAEWWTWLWRVGLALGGAAAAAMALWVLALPLAMGLATERLIAAVLRQQGVTPAPVGAWDGLRATTAMIRRTLPWRVGWPLSALATTAVLPPVGAIIGAWGVGHVAAMDALDTALAVRGWDGPRRARALAARRGELLIAGACAGAAWVAMGATIVAWPLWLPGCAAGAALRAAELSDGMPEPPAGPP